MSVLRDFVLHHARPKELGGRLVSGPMLVQVGGSVACAGGLAFGFS
jgi:hypothetical protein